MNTSSTESPVTDEDIFVEYIDASWVETFNSNNDTAFYITVPITDNILQDSTKISVDGQTPTLVNLDNALLQDNSGTAISTIVNSKYPNNTSIRVDFTDTQGTRYYTEVLITDIGDFTGGIIIMPPADSGELSYEYYVNNPTSYARVYIQLSKPLKEGSTVSVDDGTLYTTNDLTYLGFDGLQLSAVFELGSDQTTRRFNEPFLFTATLEDDTVVTRSSSDGQEIFN